MVVSADDSPLPGAARILADGNAVGAMGCSAGSRGLALARLDRVSEALAKGQPLAQAALP